METPVIRYNLKDRGRQFTGQKRNFNIRKIADAINSPATQETVATRGMLGYYGHMPRLRYGMRPVEGGFEAGKYKIVQPAIVTTFLRADYDGNVEHRAEFLDTEDGALAAKLWSSKVGGFSSAIDESKPEFFGFDYVVQPNYITNSFRGASLDCAGGEGAPISYDSVYAMEQIEQANGRALAALLDSVQAERAAANAVIERLTLENEQLMAALTKGGGNAEAALDSIGEFVRPMIVAEDAKKRIQRDRRYFLDTALPELEPLEANEAIDLGKDDYATSRLLRRWS